MAEETTQIETPQNESPVLRTKSVVQLDANGYFTGMTDVDEDPMALGSFLIPPLARDDLEAPVVTDGQRAKWNGASWVFEDLNHVPLPEASVYKNWCLVMVDRSIDLIYSEVIGNRQAEYEAAEKEAEQFLAAPEGDVPNSVASWASIKGWTPLQAAQNITAQASAWRSMSLLVMRPARLSAKEDLRALNDSNLLETRMHAWWLQVNQWRASLQLAPVPVDSSGA